MDTGYYKKYEPIFGEWSIVREIGEGSFGKVFEIERRDFGYTYKAALKAITIPQSQSEVKSVLADGMDEQSATSYFRGFVEEMVAEFVLMSKLKGHSNIVSYEDHRVVELTEGIGWDILIRMELLTPLLDNVSKNPLSRSDVIKLGIDICKALEVCRKNNIIHRDIKPENIFYSDIGDFKLGDFGIAKTVEKTTGGLSKKGTYTYMAPEVYKGEAYGASGDLYSLGIVLYRFMNNNRTPFLPPYPTPIKYADRESAMARRIKGEALPAPANADEALSRVILKACAYSPKDRYLTPADMRHDLEALLGDAEQPSDLDKTVGVFSGRNTAAPEAVCAEPLPTDFTAETVSIFKNATNNDEYNEVFNKESTVANCNVPKSFRPTSTRDRIGLMLAVESGYVSDMSELLAKGVDPNCEDVWHDGTHCSALLGSVYRYPNNEISKLLIDAGADVNYVGFVDGVKFSILHAAVIKGNVEILKFLLRKGANPNCERVLANGSRYSPLFDSISERSNDEIAKLLIDVGADVNYIGNASGIKIPILTAAIMESNVDILKLLLSKKAAPNCEIVFANGRRCSALLCSISAWPNDEIARLLINAGADVNYVGSMDDVKFPVLHAAISKSNVNILKLLLSKGANPCCERVFADGSRSSLLRDCISVWPNAQIIDLLCSYMNPLPDDIYGLKVKKSGLSEQTIQKLKSVGCKVSIF